VEAHTENLLEDAYSNIFGRVPRAKVSLQVTNSLTVVGDIEVHDASLPLIS
jgi:hypothetical protein